MDDKISISQSDLQSALQQWENAARNGETRTREETAELPVEQVAEESAAYLFAVLKGDMP